MKGARPLSFKRVGLTMSHSHNHPYHQTQLERRQASTLSPLELEATAEEGRASSAAAASAEEDGVSPPSSATKKKSISPWLLAGIVASMTLLGTVLTVVTKLMTIPMQNYPAVLTIETVFAYVPIALIYVLIRWKMGKLDRAAFRYPWKVRVCV